MADVGLLDVTSLTSPFCSSTSNDSVIGACLVSHNFHPVLHCSPASQPSPGPACHLPVCMGLFNLFGVVAMGDAPTVAETIPPQQCPVASPPLVHCHQGQCGHQLHHLSPCTTTEHGVCHTCHGQKTDECFTCLTASCSHQVTRPGLKSSFAIYMMLTMFCGSSSLARGSLNSLALIY